MGYEISYWNRIASDSSNLQVSSLPKTFPEENYTYTPVWNALKVPYTVYHRLQNVNLSFYDFTETQNLSGYTGELTQAVEKSYSGFTLKEPITQSTILADGSSTVNIFYDRNIYTLTFYSNSGDVSSTITQNLRYGVESYLNSNTFTRDGYTFLGWANTLARANALTVDYADGASYTIGSSDSSLYAVWKANEIFIDVSFSSLSSVGIDYEVSGDNIILSALIPDGYEKSSYSFTWFYTNSGMGSILGTEKTYTVDTSSLDEGYYQISLLAIYNGDSTPSGGTVEFKVEH